MKRKAFRPISLVCYGLAREVAAVANRFKKWFVQYRAERQVAAFAYPLVAKGDTKLSRNTWLGADCNFNGMLIEGHGKVVIGDHFHSGKGCMIITEFHNYRGEALPYDQQVIEKPVVIGCNVWFGNRVTVLGGVEIGEGAIIQAGAVVVADIPPLAIAGGSPAKVFGQRDPDHYAALRRKQAEIDKTRGDERNRVCPSHRKKECVDER